MASVQLLSGEIFTPSLFQGATIRNLRVLVAEYLQIDDPDRVILFTQDHSPTEDLFPVSSEETELYYAFITDPLVYYGIQTTLKMDEEGVFRLYYNDDNREVLPQELNPDSTLFVSTFPTNALSRIRTLYPVNVEEIEIDDDIPIPYYGYEEEERRRLADIESISLLLNQCLHIPNKVIN
jgi:hypothetical protein